MSKRIYILLGIITVLLTSCEDRLNVDTIASESDKMLIECELSTARRIEAKLYTIGNFNQLDKLSYPEDAVLKLGVDTDIELSFKYDDRRNVYYIDSLTHMVNPSYKYRLVAYLKDKKDIITESRTSIPSASQLTFKSEPTLSNIKNSKGLAQANISLEVSTPITSSEDKKFYRIKLIRPVFKQVVVGGQVQTLNTGKTEVLHFDGNDEIPLACTVQSDGSVLFDPNRFDRNTLKLNFSTLSLIQGDKVESVYYTLETLTEAVYRYEVSKQKLIQASQNGVSDPVISYSNMKNGYGFFGASNMTADSINFK